MIIILGEKKAVLRDDNPQNSHYSSHALPNSAVRRIGLCQAQPIDYTISGWFLKLLGPVLATNLIRWFLIWYQIESLQTLDLFRPKTCQRRIHIGKMSCSQAVASN